MGKLYIMCGIPGSGKSSMITTNEKLREINDKLIISRDKIRFSLLQPEEHYFKHEPVVEEMFYRGITKALQLGYNVFADQSSINPKSRKKLINRVAGYTEITAIWVDTPMEVCIKRDAKRQGRAHVGETVIKNMFKDFVPPTLSEGFNHIYRIDNSLDNSLLFN